LRFTPVIAALLAIALVPAAANAAPKKVRFSFSASVASVDEGAGTYNLTVLRSLNKNVSATVRVALTGTAVGGTDYTFTNPGDITFAPGQTRKSFPVTIHDDATFSKPNKTIVFTLTAVSPTGGNVQLKNNPLTLTILDNDGPGTLEFSQSSYSVIESAGAATITVSRNGNPLLAESVHYSTSDGTATAGSDYTATSGTVTFGAGEMSKTFQVPISDDQAFEGDEALNLTLDNPQNLTNPVDVPNIGPAATLTIVDDDVPTFAFSSSTYSVGEGDVNATITVNRGGATYVAADVDYSTTDGSATAGSDYTAASGTLHFAAGDTQKTFQVPITDDATAEANETVNLHLSLQGTDVSTALLSITDNDPSGNPSPSVQFSTDNYSVDEGAGTVTLTATISQAADVDVDYATAPDTASAGSDYTTTSGTLHFTAGGPTSQTFDVPILQDGAVEGDETFSATLSNATGGALIGSPNPATVTILDDDSAGTLDFSAQRYDVNENAGHVTVTVNRTGGSAGPVSVDYATLDGTAQAPGDYASTHGTLSFADGETQKTFQVPVVWDGRQEGDETVSLVLSNFASDDDAGATKVAVVHIADDGASGPVQFSAPNYDVLENAGAATITVNRSGGSLGGPVTVDYAGSDGTHGTLTFGPGEASHAFQVPVTDDNVHTGARTVNLSLANPGGGTSLGNQATATLTIGDNDPVSSSSKDLTAPKLKLTIKKNQKVSKLKRLVIKVRSNEAAKLAVKASLRKGKQLVRVAKGSKRVGQNKTVTIKLKLSQKSLAKVLAALKAPGAHGKAKIKVSVTGTDAAGNKRTISKTVVVK
jgi:hypothetical protein